ncbi:serine hydrolase domain-containing protein [Actinomadura rubrisoli]|uniref:Class A beta-lactamase-related serine hydrolase n=1 Tax=Actinomadura rubrisoli TaxID=2530368 RepID=A0A4R5A670_9ACTN|nr:serine hydrolase domain-containing protein [Actinomadura rubrisoli]TDD67451.1 class A beta-lactamase-related serine hydrolase [Actinomadura rubrisoli]
MIDGTCDPRFAAVQEAFADNFALRGEHGAAVCVTVDGRTVVDLWGGTAAPDRPWTRDTLVNFFSVGKGLTALVTARLMADGRLDVDAPVSRYWPGFGKEEVTVRHLLTHQAGLPALRDRLPPGAMFDRSVMAKALTEQEPWWRPGHGHGYHVNTFGFLIGEVVRRATGHTIGTLLREEISGPLGADVHIGLPATEHHRVAEFAWDEPPPEDDRSMDLSGSQLMTYNAYFNPGGLSGMGVINTRAWREAELPSTNGHGTARGVARVYTALAAGGHHIIAPDILTAATTEQVSGHDLVLGRPSRFGLGFQLTQPERPLGPNPRSFGHFGAGGSLGFCDPDTGMAFGYVMNEMGPRWQNPRNRALVDAVYACL